MVTIDLYKKLHYIKIDSLKFITRFVTSSQMAFNLRLGEMERDATLNYPKFPEEIKEPKTLDERYDEYIAEIKRFIPEGYNLDDEKIKSIHTFQHFLNFIVGLEHIKRAAVRVRVISLTPEDEF